MKNLFGRNETRKLTVITAILLIFVSLMVSTIRTTKINSPVVALEKSYEIITENDCYADDGHHVVFGAFFAKDLNGDGRDERILGSCNKIGNTDTLLINIGVNSGGQLQNGKITISGKQGYAKNFNYQVSMLAGPDDILANDCVSDSVTTINFKTIQAGRQKLISGNINAAINGNKDAFSSINQVTLTGTFVPDEGEPIQINKTFDLTVDWYGTATTSVQTSGTDVNVSMLEEDNEIIAKLSVKSNTRGLLTKERIVRVQIPDLFGYYPEVEIINQTADKECAYDEESHILTITREDVTNESNDTIRLTYPGEAYAPLKAYFNDKTQYNIYAPVTAYSLCYNNPNEGFQNPYQTTQATGSANIRFFVSEESFDEFLASMSIMDKVYLDRDSSGWSKSQFLNMYDAEESQTFEYRVNARTARNRMTQEPKKVTLYNGDNFMEKLGTPSFTMEGLVITSSDPFCGRIDSLGITIENGIVSFEGEDGKEVTYTEYYNPKRIIQEDDGTVFGGYNSNAFVKTTAISFNDTTLLRDDGYIKIYNADTNELIKELTNGEWFLYKNGNKLNLDVDVSRIRIETSEDDNRKLGVLDTVIYKKIDIDMMKETISRSALERATSFSQSVLFTLFDGNEQSNTVTGTDTCTLYDVRSYASVSVQPDVVMVGAENENVTISVNVPGQDVPAPKRAGWIDGKYLVRISKAYITSLDVNDVTTRSDGIAVEYNTLNEDDDYYYVEIQTRNTERETIQDGDIIYTQKKKADNFTININGKVSVNPMSVSGSNYITLFYYNPAHEMYINQTEDIYDIDNDGNTNDIIGITSTALSISAPNDFKASQSITNYNDNLGAKEIFAPGTVKVDTGRRTAKIHVKFVNRNQSDVLNFKLQGKIPFENNTFINGSALGSTFSTKMTNDGITLPEEFANGATVYYSEAADPTDDLTVAANGWKLKSEFATLENVKSYLIVVDNGKITKGKVYDITYDIQIPEDVDSNEVSYSCFKAKYDIYVNNGLLNVEVQPDKLGIRMVQYYDINIAKYKAGTDRLVSGPVFRLNGNVITANNGEIKAAGLVVNNEYILEEINGGNFERKQGSIKFKVVKEGTGLKFVKLSDSTAEFDDEVIFTQKQSGRYVMESRINDTPKVRMTINKVDLATNEPIKDVKFIIDNSKLMRTDDNGNITFDVTLNEEHSIKEYPNEGYYKIEDITFTVREINNAYVIESNNENFSSVTPVNDNTSDFIEAQVNLVNELIPTYELSIQKIDKERETPLEGVKFVLKKSDLKTQEYFTTDENGMINISNLYQYVEGKNITGKYTLQEVSGKNGYIFNNEEIEFYVKKNSVNQLEIVITDEENLESIKEHTTTSKKVNLVITNKPLFKLIKIDSKNTEKTIPDVQFILYLLDDDGNEVGYAKDIYGEYVGTENINGEYIVTTDENGEISLPLPNGKYKAVEVGFPEGYEDSTNIQYFAVTGNTEEENPENPDEEEDDEEEEQVTLDINYIEDLVDVRLNNNGYAGYTINLQRDLDFEDDNSYRDPTSTERGDLNNDGTIEDIKTELTKRGTRGYVPISSFRGTFDGQNHKIDNLFIDSRYIPESSSNSGGYSRGYIGLFSLSYGTIKNLSVGGQFEIENVAYTGGIVGEAYAGLVENCHSSVDIHISGTGYSLSVMNVGGVTSGWWASNHGKVVGCSYSGNITGGINWTINVYGVAYYAEKSYNLGNIDIISEMSSATAYGVAYNAVDCYNRGTVKATSNDSEDGTATAYGVAYNGRNVYNTGNVYALGTAASKRVDAVGGVSNAYYLNTIETSTAGKTTNGTSKTEAEMKTEQFVTKLGRISWILDSTKNDGFPINTEQDDYVEEINYIEDLVRLSIDSNTGYGSHYYYMTLELKRDLDFNDDASYKNPNDTKYGDLNNNGIVQGIKDEMTDVDGEGFEGITLSNTKFDGKNHKISNLYINKSEANNVGLFKNAQVIENLGVTGTIKADRCYHVSGIANFATIKNCYSDVDITTTGVYSSGYTDVAGITGTSNQSLFCYSLGDISVTATNATSISVYGISQSTKFSYNRGNITVNFTNSTNANIYGVAAGVNNGYNTGNYSVSGTASTMKADAVGDAVTKGFYSTDAAISGNATTNGTGKTLDYMKTADFLDDLSAKYWKQIAEVNDGLPVANEMSNVYITKVNYIEDLIKIGQDVDGGINYSGVNITLERTLDFTEDASYEDPTSTVYGDINRDGTIEDIKTELTTSYGFTPIGYPVVGREFAGNFNGQGYEINNLYIKRDSTNDSYLGLFGFVYNSKIENLTVSGSIRGTSSIYDTAGICGAVSGTCEFNNCINKVNISFAEGYYIGGIVGQTYYSSSGFISSTFTFKNCKNYGFISSGGAAEVGGICGATQSGTKAEFEKCENHGSITEPNKYYVAGIVGYNTIPLSVTDCYNYASMTSSGNYFGGIVGTSSAPTTIKNCGNGDKDERNVKTLTTTNYSSYAYMGGIIGYAGATLTIEDCYNTMKITAVNGSYAYVGGIIGNAFTNGDAKNLYNYGNVTAANSSDTRIGGICGQSNLKLTNCHNEGYIQNRGRGSYHYIGGIDGYHSNSSAEIKDCTNSGTIDTYTGYIYVGGIAGLYGNITRCINTGDIIVVNGPYTGSMYIGGIHGSTSTSNTISYSENLGNIRVEGSNGLYLGGIAAEGTVAYCHNGGSINVDINRGGVSAYVGGVTGQGTSTRSYNTAPITFDRTNTSSDSTYLYLGGVVGSGSYAQESSNSEKINVSGVYSYQYIGGILGSGRSILSYNTGNIENTAVIFSDQDVGGVTGQGGVVNSYNQGNIENNVTITSSGHIAVGGLAGTIESSSVYSYNTGDVISNVSGASPSSSSVRASGPIYGRTWASSGIGPALVYSDEIDVRGPTINYDNSEEKEDQYMKTTEFYDYIKTGAPDNWKYVTGQYPILDNPMFIGGSTEATELVVKNTPLNFKVTAEVVANSTGARTGGTVSGDTQPNTDVKLIENIDYDGTSTKDIVITPNDGYRIDYVKVNNKLINLELDETDNSMTIPAGYFKDVQRNYHITAKFEVVQSELNINKVDDLGNPVENATFEIQEIDERPEVDPSVLGTIVNDSYTYSEEITSSPVTGVIGEMQHASGQQYYFVQRDGKYVSNNKGVNNSFAESYVEIDLTGRTGKYMLMVNMSASSSCTGYAKVTSSDVPMTASTTSGSMLSVSYTSNYTGKTSLTGGYKYYLHFGYNRNTTSMNTYYQDEIYINSINLYDAITYNPHFELEDGKYVGKELDGHKYNTDATSRIPLDLRAYTGKYDITINAEKTGKASAYVTIDESNSRSTSSYNAVVSMGDSTKDYPAKDYTTTLLGGKLYYIHIYSSVYVDAGTHNIKINSITFSRNTEDYLFIDSIKTNAAGKINLNVKNGKYKVTELEAPDGYILDDTPQIVTVTTDSVNNLTFVNQSKKNVRVHYYMKGTGPEFDNDPVLVSADKNYYGYTGDSYVTQPVLRFGKFTLQKDENNQYILPSNATGTFGSAPIDVYYYYEAMIPQGSFKLEMTKIQGNDAATRVEGAEFDVYKMNAFEFTKIGTLTDQGNGLYSTENIAIQDAGELELVIKETVVPTGYQAVSDIHMTLTIDEDEDNNAYVVNGTSFGEVDFNRYENKNSVVDLTIYEPLLSLKYEVHYYLDGEEDTSLAETDLYAPYGSEISDYEDKCPRTYLFDKVKALDDSGLEKDLPLVIKLEEEKNIINVYYKKAHGYFKVNATKVNAADSSIKVSGAEFDIFDTTGTTEVKIGTLADKGNGQYESENIEITEEKTINVKIKETVVPDGYKKAADITGTITFEFDEENGVYVVSTNLGTVAAAGNEYNLNKINMTIDEEYDEYEYSVHYFYEKIDVDGEYVENTDKIETGSAVFGSKISTYEAKVIEGYEFNHDETEDKDGVKGNLPLTITSNKNNNKINVYYSKQRDLSYTVHYREQGVDGDAGKLANDKIVPDQTFGDVVTENAINIPGYIALAPTSANITITTGTNEHTFYYAKLFNITTDITEKTETKHDGTTTDNVKGGTISGEDETPYESVQRGNSNTKAITVEANEGYVIKNIKVNGTEIDYSSYVQRSVAHKVVLPEGYFTDIQENKNVTAEFDKVSNVKVRYMVNNTDTKLAEDIDIPGVAGDSFATTYKTFTGYKLNSIKDQDGTVLSGENNVISGNMYADELVVTYWYDIDNSTITEEHILINEDSSTQTLETQGHEGQVGTSETLNRKTYDNYEAAEGPASQDENVIVVGKTEYSKEVTYASNVTKTVRFYYGRKDAKVTVHYVEKATNTEISEVTEIPGKAGRHYTTSPKTIANYVLLEGEDLPANAEGDFAPGNIDVYYYYAKDKAKITEKHIDITNGSEVILETHEYTQDVTTTKTFNRLTDDNYVAADGPEGTDVIIIAGKTENTKTVTFEQNKDKEVRFYYVKAQSKITEKHIDITTGEEVVLDSHEYTQNVGTSKTFNRLTDETYVAADAPANVPEGIIVVGKTENSREVTFEANKNKEIRFYYVKAKSKIIEKHIDITDGSEVILEEHEYTDNVGETKTLNRLTDVNYVAADAPADVPEGIIVVAKTENSKEVGYEVNKTKEVRFYYVKAQSKITEKHIDITTGEEVIIEEHEYTENVGTSKTLTRLTNNFYVGADAPADVPEGIIIVGKTETSKDVSFEANKDKEVRFYYVKAETVITEKHIDITTGEEVIISAENHTGTVGTSITFNRLPDDIYLAADAPENVPEGIITVGKDDSSITETFEPEVTKEVRFYYTKRTGKVIVEYVDNITGEKVKDDTVIEKYIDESYEVTRETIPGYKLDEDHLPTNETGTIKKDPQTVTYTYIELRPYELLVRYTVEHGDNDQAKFMVKFNDTQINDYTTNGILKIGDIELTDLEKVTYTLYETETPEFCDPVITEEHPAVVELEGTLNTDANKYEFVANYEAIEGFNVIIDEENHKVIFDVTTSKDVKFDLAIQKFVSAINGVQLSEREPKVQVVDGKVTYTKDNEIVKTENNRLVTYTVRVYNESENAAFGKRLIEYIPDGLVFVPENETNRNNGWKMYKVGPDDKYVETTNVDEAVIVATDHIAGTRIEKASLEDGVVNYLDTNVVFKVDESKLTNDDRIIENSVRIIKNENDENTDNDVTTEKLYVKYFDLSIEKFIEEVKINTNGTEEVRKVGYAEKGNLVKVDIKKSAVKNSKVTVTYGILIKNVGELPGYATEITDYIPENFKLINNENEWVVDGNKAITVSTSDKLLKPGESETIYITFEWNLAEGTIGTRRNEAEITAYTNDYDAEDVTKDNKDGEDLLVSLKTGSEAITIALIATAMVGTLALGVYGIRKIRK